MGCIDPFCNDHSFYLIIIVNQSKTIDLDFAKKNICCLLSDSHKYFQILFAYHSCLFFIFWAIFQTFGFRLYQLTHLVQFILEFMFCLHILISYSFGIISKLLHWVLLIHRGRLLIYQFSFNYLFPVCISKSLIKTSIYAHLISEDKEENYFTDICNLAV